jgi:hypothetical protein
MASSTDEAAGLLPAQKGQNHVLATILATFCKIRGEALATRRAEMGQRASGVDGEFICGKSVRGGHGVGIWPIASPLCLPQGDLGVDD